jgi:hypothetical protein
LIRIIIFLALTISFSSAFSQIDNEENNNNFLDDFEEVYGFQSDFLVPTESLLHSAPYRIKYYEKIKEILFAGLPEYIDIQYLSKPSFDTERVLVIRKGEIYYNIAKQSIWGTYYKEISDRTDTVKIELNKIKVDRYTNKISDENAELINKLYRLAISKARFLIFSPDELNRLVVGNDGTSHSFSISNNGTKEGATWSPDTDSRMYRLVEIHKDLIKVVKRTASNSEIVLPSKLEEDIKKLIDEINLSDLDFEKETIGTIKDTIVSHLNRSLPIKKLIDDGYTYVSDDLIFTISEGKIKKVKEQEPYYDRDYSKFRNWFNNLFDKKVGKHYKRALKDLDLTYLNLELDLKVYIDFELDKENFILTTRK